MTLLCDFARTESGATAIECGLIAGLVALAIAAGATIKGNSLSGRFQRVRNRLNNET